MRHLFRWLLLGEQPEIVSHWWCYDYRCLAQGVGARSDKDSSEHTLLTNHMTGISDRVRISR